MKKPIGWACWTCWACCVFLAAPLALAQDPAQADAHPALTAPAPAKGAAKDVAKAGKKAETKKSETQKAQAQKKQPSEKQAAQQARVRECNAEAGEKKGEARKKFMSACVKEKQKAQQQRLTACGKEANDRKMKGDERKAFMKECLAIKKN
ncbi:MAG: phosphate starvation-inducible protein PsiF [Betaproteobacteria bacterium]|nr:phosphate starvation-inducible protein PsiF [Betaproteobacteria bacterium]